MSTSLHTVFEIISGSGYFILVSSNIQHRKMRFSAGSQNSITKKLIFGEFEVIFANAKKLSKGGMVVSCKHIQCEVF